MNWYERNEKTESSADRREFVGAIFNAYRPQSSGNALVPVLAYGIGYAIGSALAKAKK